MKTRINLHVKQLTSICIVLVLLLSTISFPGTIAHATETDFEEITLTLRSNIVDDDAIDLYLLDSVHYIALDDLCRLTRCTKYVDGDVISITQGIWRAEFNTVNQTFYDGYQTVNVTIMKIAKEDYAVPALMFLSYYKAMALIENDILYCELPECTAWEALDLDYRNSLANIYELYGGEGNVKLSLTLDILMDFIMGKNLDAEKYLKSAYYKALDVDIYSYNAVKQYVGEKNEALYNDLVAEETQNLLKSLSNICKTGDTANKITQEAMDLYIFSHCMGSMRDFYNLAYDAKVIGDIASMRRYADRIASVWREGEFQKSLVKYNAKNVEGAFFLLSSAIESAQQVKYVYQENNLVYRVMGQENLKKLSLDVEDNEWYAIANVYKSTSTSLQNSFVNILNDLQTVAIDDLVSEAAEKIGVDTFLENAASKATGIKGIKAASWKIGLEVGRGAVQALSWVDSLAEPDSLIDVLLVDVGAYEADRLALYLSELQQNVYWVLCHEYERLYNNWGDVNAYQDYIYAQQLYCRTSIAMYENLIATNDEFGKDKDYWRSLFQERIDMLAISLYQLTTLQDDGVDTCLPLDLNTFKQTSKYGQVALGYYHSAVIKSDKTLWTWGNNDNGQLGDGSTTTRNKPVKIMDDVVSVSLGAYHSAAIKTDGSLWMWGVNSDGELGDGTTSPSNKPKKIMDNVVQVSLGEAHSAAIKTDGSLWMWGNNSWGQLGDGTTISKKKPVKILSGVEQISLGNVHSAAIKTDGSLWTWGCNWFGQLGDSSFVEKYKPKKIMTGVEQVSLGYTHSAAVKTDGSLWTWGSSSSGRLGRDSKGDCNSPNKVLEGVKQVCINGGHSAAIKTDGSLWMWGDNFSGELGIGNNSDSLIPQKVISDVDEVSVGAVHSAAIKTDGSLWMWGNNYNGQLGDGSEINKNIPVLVFSLKGK